MALALLVMGSNLGNRKENLKRGKLLVERFAGPILRETPPVETAPFGVTKQPPFLNCGLLIETDHPPLELLRLLKWIEKRAGRYPTYRWGPRVLDVDIALYEGVKRETEELKLPHPGLKERPFFREIARELLSGTHFLFNRL
ncbi:2-amino-4-hydroxy-6-hydroxymethyldihydropteridine diphosphokinase [Thermovibrio ammonificans]|jgi:2-amino-4-hydroxy-6-hydroxymethyldihydropteridine diphosphokinase